MNKAIDYEILQFVYHEIKNESYNKKFKEIFVDLTYL